jgi:3-phenylpropionate/trans-cinnamate dioxygenase ferredoxin reductase component
VPDRDVDFLLIGGGVASANCARWLRESGAQGTITVLGRELDPPYERPPCSKDYLAGDRTREEALFRPPGWWEKQGIELLTRTSVLKLDPHERVARLQSKEEIGFGQALLATGAMVRRLRAEGADLEGIHYLRALGNADAIRRDVEDAERVVLIGGSYIGSEVAATLTAMGKRCTILMQEPVALSTGFGEQAGRFFQGILEERGIEIVPSDSLDRFEGTGERVTAVVTEGGRRLEADVVVVGVGANPDVMLARSSGLELGETGGVRCDSRLRTSAEGVFAAGDMCEFESVIHGGPVRIEHHEVALAQGKTAALNMLGADRPHDTVPYFWCDLSDWVGLEYVGGPGRGDEEVLRGSMEDGEFSLWYLREGRVLGALSVHRPGDLDHARRLIREGVVVGVGGGALSDAGGDLAAV